MRCPSCGNWNDVIYRTPVHTTPSPFRLAPTSAPVPFLYRWECRYCGATHQVRGLEVEKSFPARDA
jgi:hypothetical protein